MHQNNNSTECRWQVVDIYLAAAQGERGERRLSVFHRFMAQTKDASNISSPSWFCTAVIVPSFLPLYLL